jgi:excisionase family DNA binding protein
VQFFVMSTTHISQLEFGHVADRIQLPFEEDPVNGKQPALVIAPTTEREGLNDQPSPAGAKLTPRGAAPRAVKRSIAALEELLTLADAAAVLGISLRQFRRLVDGGKIAFIKVSERSPRIRPSELQRFLTASVVQYSEVKS